MEIGQSAIQRGVRAQPGRNPVDMLNEGQIFSGKVMKSLPGQMAELAAFDQKITAQLEVPLKRASVTSSRLLPLKERCS